MIWGSALFAVEGIMRGWSRQREVPEGLWKLAGGKTAPAVAAPGNGRQVVSVLKGRRNELFPSLPPPRRGGLCGVVVPGAAPPACPRLISLAPSEPGKSQFPIHPVPPKTARNLATSWEIADGRWELGGRLGGGECPNIGVGQSVGPAAVVKKRQLTPISPFFIKNRQFLSFFRLFWGREALQNALCTVQIVFCSVQNAFCTVQRAFCIGENAFCRQEITFCTLQTPFCSGANTFCSDENAFCRQEIVFSPRGNTFSRRANGLAAGETGFAHPAESILAACGLVPAARGSHIRLRGWTGCFFNSATIRFTSGMAWAKYCLKPRQR